MIKRLWIRTRWIVVLLVLGFPCTSLGSGLYLYELGIPEVGLAGAGWSARAQDAATAFTNPAGMVRLDRSEETIDCLRRFSGIIAFDSIDNVVEQANLLATEHLEIQCGDQTEAVAEPEPSRAAVYEQLLPIFRRAAETQSELGDMLAGLDC